MTLRAVLFDIDFTLARPGPELRPEGYVSCGELHGLALDALRYEEARDAALVDLKRHPDLDHDEEIWVAFRKIVVGMGGTQPASRDVAVELTSRWQLHENFELYEDVLPVLEELRQAGLKLGLVSNSARDVRDFARHHALAIDAGISSFQNGKTKPPRSIFTAVLDLLSRTGRGVMVATRSETTSRRSLGMRGASTSSSASRGLQAAPRRPL
jgi:FMN phosphatase YigB (HAD superfamily)